MPNLSSSSSRFRLSAALAKFCIGAMLLGGHARADFDFYEAGRVDAADGTMPAYVAWGDLNGDGVLDAAVVESQAAANRVQISIGLGAGTFRSGAVVGTSGAKGAVGIADLNADGKRDLIVLKLTGGIIQVHLGNGNGTFGAATDYSLGTTSGTYSSLELADMDGDGKMDAVCGAFDNGIIVLKGNGTGGFLPAPYFVFDGGGGVNPKSLNVVDLDGDHELDIAYSPRVAFDIVCLTNVRRGGTRSAAGFGLQEFKMLAVARNFDGNVSFAIAESAGGTTEKKLVYGKNPVQPTQVIFEPQTQLGWGNPVLTDIDKDGYSDLVIGYVLPHPAIMSIIQFRRGQATGNAFSPVIRTLLATRGSPNQVSADINGDGWPDLATATGSVFYYRVHLQSPPRVITSADHADFEVGFPGTFTVTSTGRPPVSYSYSGTLPAGVSFTSQGVLSGTPAANTVGDYLISITMSDSAGPPITRGFLLRVLPPLVPRVILPDAQNVTMTSAALLGQIQTDNGLAVTRRGVVYAPTAVNPNPQLGGAGVVVVDDSILTGGPFGVQATGLTPATAYSFVAFAQNARGVGYTSVATFFTPPDPNAGSLVVTTLTDENDGNSAPSLGTGTSLREAIAYAKTLGGNQTITFLPSLYAGGATTTTLTLGELPILNFTGTLTIAGPGADELTIQAGTNARIFRVESAGLQLNGLTLTGAVGSDGGAIRTTGTLTVNDCVFSQNTSATNGGAIYQLGGTTTVMRSTFTGNAAANPAGNPFTGLGGAIANGGGTVWVINSTLYGNSATTNGSGGGGAIITTQSQATTRIINSTIVGNSADGATGGVYLIAGNVVVQNTVVAGNTAPFEANINSGIPTAGLGNVIGGNITDLFTTAQPANNGGTTATFALKAGSAAINAGLNALAVNDTGATLATDQLGGVRIASATVDAGATEYATIPNLASATLANVTATSATLGGNVISDGGALLRRGIIFSRTIDNANPALGGNSAIVVEVPGTSGVFSTPVNLVPRTSYSFVAFAESSLGTVYSGVLTFATPEFASLNVTTTSDAVDPTDGQTSLREAVTYAMSGTAGTDPVITFDLAIFASAQTITLNGTQLPTLTQNVTINGPAAGVTINGNNQSRIFQVTAGTVNLKRLTVTRGLTDTSNGGGIVQFGGTLKLSECTVSHNRTVESFGGGIALSSGTLELLNSTFSGNSSEANPNSASAGGALFIESGTVRATNCTFTGNRAIGPSDGGAIFHAAGDVTLVNCTIVGNAAVGTYEYGGGIESVGGSVRCANTIIAGNSGQGAPDLLISSPLSLSLGNNLIGIRDPNGIFVDGVNGDRVGTSASPLDPLVGTLAYNGGPTQTMALLPGSPAIDAGNNALVVDASNAPLTADQRGASRITRGNVASPGARVDIGAYEYIGIPIFTTSQFILTAGNTNAIDLNSATGAFPFGGLFSGTGVANGIFNPTGLAPGVYTITYTVTDEGGASNSDTVTVTINEAPSLIVTTPNDVTSPLDNVTSLREAIVFAQSLGGTPTITFAPALNGQTVTLVEGATGANDDTALRNGSDLTIDGGAGVTINLASPVPRRHFLHGGGTLNLRNLTFSGGDIRTVNDGGVLYNVATVNVTNVRFTNNRANNGGAVMNLGTMTVENSTFDNNDATTANAQGGAIWSNSTLAVSGTTFYLNSAGVLGGAIASFNGLMVANCNFSTNHSDFNGGAVRLDGTAAISSSTFSNNTAVNGGGAIMSHGATTLTNVTVAYNTALDGGGIQFFDGVPTLRHATIAYNTATRFGGGIAVNFADVTLKNTLIAGNAESSSIGSFNAASSNNLLGLTDVQAGLGAFALNGGSTFTIALLPGSPAVDSGIAIAGVTVDQRGIARPQAGGVDIGAFELIPAQPAATPLISPASGTYLNSVTVSLSTASTGATIRFTLDGSAPSETTGTIYTGPFALNTSATVRAIAVSGGWLPSPITSATYTVQTPLEAWRALHGLAADGSQDLANPSGDGVANILKYAFNLAPNTGDLSNPNTTVLPANGTAGLPFITRDAQGRLSIEFIRRKAATQPGVTYIPEISADAATWTPVDLTNASVEPIDTNWERVSVIAGQAFTREIVYGSEENPPIYSETYRVIFGRVRVSTGAF